jgi:hypothetical protein
VPPPPPPLLDQSEPEPPPPVPESEVTYGPFLQQPNAVVTPTSSVVTIPAADTVENRLARIEARLAEFAWQLDEVLRILLHRTHRVD